MSKTGTFLVGLMFEDDTRFRQADVPGYLRQLEAARDRKLATLPSPARVVTWRTFIGTGKAGKPQAYATARYELLA